MGQKAFFRGGVWGGGGFLIEEGGKKKKNLFPHTSRKVSDKKRKNCRMVPVRRSPKKKK